MSKKNLLEKNFNKLNLNNIILIIIFFFGIFIAFNRGSNFSDGDSYSVILSFLNFIDYGIYTPSKGGYGHPIPELIIGLSSFFLGVPISNVICFIFLFFALILLYKTFLESHKNLSLFILLTLSNYYILFDNTNSIDNPFAIFFFASGLFYLKQKRYLLSYLLLGFAIASRANFLIFIYPIILIFYYSEIKQWKFNKIIYSFLTITLVGLIFYIPLFHTHNYSLDFLELPFINEGSENAKWYGGPELKLESLIPRFIYKIYLLVGIYTSLLMIFFFKDMIKNIQLENKDNQIFFLVIFANLFLFFFMPTKILIINPFIIFFYIYLFKILSDKKILLIISFNILSWFLTYSIVNIEYKHNEICAAKEALSYNYEFVFKKGYFVHYIFSNVDMTSCYSPGDKYWENFEKGKPLFLSN